MRGRPDRRWVIAAAAAVAVLASGAALATERGSASPRAEVVTLTFANSDGEFDAIPEVERFVDRVETLSRGQLKLNVIGEWGQGKPSYERTVVRDVQRGKADLAWLGVRVLDTFGVKSFQALQAPMLIDSYPLQRAVLRSDMPAAMLADLDRIGLVGLSLVANELRHPFATKGPIAKPADFRGKRVRVYASEVQTLTMRALGARPSYEGWADVGGALTIGRLHGMESDLVSYVNNEYPSIAPFATVNVTLWPSHDRAGREHEGLRGSQPGTARLAAAGGCRRHRVLAEAHQYRPAETQRGLSAWSPSRRRHTLRPCSPHEGARPGLYDHPARLEDEGLRANDPRPQANHDGTTADRRPAAPRRHADPPQER
jgi:TRAP-type C4-dicarboxylate transport system substrate-binding protein